MKTLFLLHIVILALLANEPVLAEEGVLPHDIIVITSNKRPVTNSAYVTHRLQQVGGTLAVYNLDAVQSLEDTWSHGLPVDEASAKKQFETSLQAYGTKQFEQDIVHAYQGLLHALAYKVDRYPVIIFDGSAAIYGVTDIKLALEKHQAWRLSQND